jgi:hypothetical protein
MRSSTFLLILGLFPCLAACDDLSSSQYHPPTTTGAGGQSGTTTTTASTTATTAATTTATTGPTTQGTGGAATSSTSTTTGSSTGGGGAATTTTGGGGSDVDGGGGSGGGTDDASADVPVDAGLSCAGYALELPGTGYLQTNRIVQDDFTLEAWMKTTVSLTGVNFYEGAGFIYADVAGSANDFGTSILSSKFAFGVGNPDTTIHSTSDVTTGQWVHVAATRQESNGQIQIFVNGQLEASMLVAQISPLSAQSVLSIGANTIDNRYFNGVVDEIRLWSIVRTQQDIQATMHKTLVGNEPGLVTYYRADEGTGANVGDSSSSKNDAILAGVANWIPSDAPVCP